MPGDRPHWDSWYGQGRWRRRRRAHLQQFPFCAYCLQRGVVVLADAVDQVVHHRGVWNDFILGPLQSLCHSCHGTKRKEDNDGFSRAIDESGYPLDPRHPCYK